MSAAGGRPARGDLNVRVHFITINSTLIRSLSFSYRLSTTREHRKRISDQSDCRLVTRSVATSTWHWRLWRHIGGRVALHSRHTNERAAYACGRHEETTAYARDLLPSSILVVQCSASLSWAIQWQVGHSYSMSGWMAFHKQNTRTYSYLSTIICFITFIYTNTTQPWLLQLSYWLCRPVGVARRSLLFSALTTSLEWGFVLVTVWHRLQ